MRIYCAVDIIEGIIIIDNSEGALSSRRKKRLLIEYGHLENFVRFFDSREISQVSQAHGYDRQQVLKLMVSLIIESERYVVLDAKNHLVFTLERSFLEAPDGRACINIHDYTQDILRPHLERVLAYLNVDPTLW